MVSAAHCFLGTSHSSWTFVYAGNIKYASDGTGSQYKPISRIITHPYVPGPILLIYCQTLFRAYNRESNQNDIAIVKLRYGFEYTEYVRPVCLPEAGFEVRPGNGLISGFGRTQFGSTNFLQFTTVPILSHEECKSNAYFGSRYSPQTNICAGSKGRDTCYGDSGGPLVVNVNDRFVLLGVTSWGIECGDEAKPGLYAKVSSYIDWINQN